MNQAIITGATGFIGSVVVSVLIKNNIEVLALGRKNLKEVGLYKRQLLEGSTYIKIDMSEIDQLPEKISEIGLEMSDSCVFYNLAWGGKDKLSDLNIEAQLKNVSWSVSAMIAAKELNCERFVHIGTMEEAFTSKYLGLDYHKNNEYNRHVIYSVAKIISKNYLKLMSKSLGLDLLFATNSHVMGPADDKDSFLQMTLQKLINGDELLFSEGNQIFDCISVDDLAQAYYEIGEKGLAGSDYWAGSGKPRKLKEYVKIMYDLYPSGRELQFGKFTYNDISLEYEDFSIDLLTEHTGFIPKKSYEQTVKELHAWLISE
ncbi:NAD(P)-dependent oxidoreductase [Flavobacteriaceae bacterium]|nr:NAD(P)-dependent oxidoreductase [Flavobacteriaceae bacterium]